MEVGADEIDRIKILRDQLVIGDFDTKSLLQKSDQLKDTANPFHGLGLFKTSFSKTVTDFVGCYDQVLKPLKYKAWMAAGERVARQLYTRRTGQQFY